MKLLQIAVLGFALCPLGMAVTNNLVGHITYLNGDPMGGVVVNLISGTAIVQSGTTNPDGTFHLMDVSNGAYTVMPVNGTCLFTPTSRDIVVTRNLNNINFVGACAAESITLISPPNGAVDVPLTPTLSWSAPGATSYQVYFGIVTDPAQGPPYLANATSESYPITTPLSFGTTYGWRVRATNDGVNWVDSGAYWTFTTVAAEPPPGLHFVPVPPCRVADTRETRGMTGNFGPPSMAANTTRTFPMFAAPCGLPATAKAYSVNITALPIGQSLGYVTAWQTGATRPVSSTLNSQDGSVVANAAVIPAGTDGSVDVYASDPTDLIVDVNGYFDDQAGSAGQALFPLVPCRIIDTRKDAMPTGFGLPALEAGESRNYVVPTAGCALPMGAAYSLNLTALPLTNFLGFLSAYPTSGTRPVVSSLNSFDGSITANQAIVPATSEGSLTLYAADRTHLLADVNGYFNPQAAGGLAFYPVVPCRLIDTRATAPLTSGSTHDIPVAGAAECGVPAEAQAVAVNITAVPQGPLGYLLAWPSGVAQPLASTLNSPKGLLAANGAIVKLGSNGAVSLFVSDTTNVFIDVMGYFQ